MQRAYRLLVEYEGLERELYREFIVNSSYSLYQLGMLILVSFDAAMEKELRFERGDVILSIMRPAGRPGIDKGLLDADTATVSIRSLRLVRGSVLYALYGDETDHAFIIRFIEAVDVDEGEELPRLIDGKGKGIIDDVGPFHFIPAVRDMLREGVSYAVYRCPATGILTDWSIDDFSLDSEMELLPIKLKSYGVT